jgi:hypothetical protein
MSKSPSRGTILSSATQSVPPKPINFFSAVLILEKAIGTLISLCTLKKNSVAA